MPQIPAGEAPIQERWLQNRSTCEGAFDSRRIDGAAGLTLQIAIAADMIRIGVRVVYGSQMPSVCIENLPNLSACILVISAVDQADVILIQSDQSDFGRTLNIIVSICDLYQFIHNSFSAFPDNRPWFTVCLE